MGLPLVAVRLNYQLNALDIVALLMPNFFGRNLP